MNSKPDEPGLYAISDLHVRHSANRTVVDALRPATDRDWLLVAGDVAETVGDVFRTMELLSRRFAKVIWTPGNHELWTPPKDPVYLRGEERYFYLVEMLRGLGVVTPEDPYPVWPGPDGDVVVAPLFVLYDHTFLPAGARTEEEALAAAHAADVIPTDEFLLHPDPYPSRAAWCRVRLDYTRARLDRIDPELPVVLVNHFPLIREPTRILRHPEFALWCGTEATSDWPVRYRAAAVVYGHLHVPRTIERDGVPHHEVSLGYPQEWRDRGSARPSGPHQVLPGRVGRR